MLPNFKASNKDIENLEKLIYFMAINEYRRERIISHKRGIIELVFYNGSNISKHFVKWDAIIKLEQINILRHKNANDTTLNINLGVFFY